MTQPVEQLPPDGDRPFNRVLYVDDIPDVAHSAADMLRVAGFEVRVAFDGPTALAEAEGFRPGICVLDLSLPRMAGDELAAKLREQAARRPLFLVAITGANGREARRRLAAAGFHAHLVKPADPERFVRLLKDQQERGDTLPPTISFVL